jgi:hypothetical protein
VIFVAILRRNFNGAGIDERKEELPMEQLEARIESIQRIAGDRYLMTVSVSTCWPPEESVWRDQKLYRLEIDLESSAMTPKDDLQDCFDAHHKFEYSDGLNPKLQRQWKTASLVDGIVDIVFKSHLLQPMGIEERR